MQMNDIDSLSIYDKCRLICENVGDAEALVLTLNELHDKNEALKSLLKQDVYGDYDNGECVCKWWLKGSEVVDAVEHLDLVGFDASRCLDEVIKKLDL